MKKLSKTQINISKIDQTITNIVYKNKTYNIGDMITWNVVGLWKIVGFTNNNEALVKNTITSIYTKGSGNVECIDVCMIYNVVTKQACIDWLNECIHVVKTNF